MNFPKGEAGKKNSDKEQYTVEFDRTNRIKIVQGHEKKEKGRGKGAGDALYYVGFIGDIGFTIAIPIVGGGLLGTYIDRTWSTYPKATLSLLFLGILLSILGFIRTVGEIINRK